MGCGTKGNVTSKSGLYYALEITDGANMLHFDKCHFEHCRYFLRSRSSFTTSFVDCKFEQSGWGIDGTYGTAAETMPPIYLYHTACYSFSACNFAAVIRDGYINAGIEPQYFIVTENTYDRGAVASFSGCNIQSSTGSGTVTVEGERSALFIKTLDYGDVVISGNNIIHLDKNQGIVLKNSIATGNRISAHTTDGTYAIDLTNSIFTSNALVNIAEAEISKDELSIIGTNILR